MPAPAHPFRAAAGALLVVALGASSPAADNAPEPAPAVATVRVEAVPNPRPAQASGTPAAPTIAAKRPTPSPLRAELDAVLAAERAQLRRLEAEVRASAGTDAALALQRQIAQVKQNTEIELLRVQARHARREGRGEVADAIDAVIRELLMTPEERAALERARAESAVPLTAER